MEQRLAWLAAAWLMVDLSILCSLVYILCDTNRGRDQRERARPPAQDAECVKQLSERCCQLMPKIAGASCNVWKWSMNLQTGRNIK